MKNLKIFGDNETSDPSSSCVGHVLWGCTQEAGSRQVCRSTLGGGSDCLGRVAPPFPGLGLKKG